MKIKESKSDILYRYGDDVLRAVRKERKRRKNKKSIQEVSSYIKRTDPNKLSDGSLHRRIQGDIGRDISRYTATAKKHRQSGDHSKAIVADKERDTLMKYNKLYKKEDNMDKINELRSYILEHWEILGEGQVDETIYTKSGVILKRAAKPLGKAVKKAGKMRWDSKLKKLVPSL